jgi:hypothetical protein
VLVVVGFGFAVVVVIDCWVGWVVVIAAVVGGAVGADESVDSDGRPVAVTSPAWRWLARTICVRGAGWTASLPIVVAVSAAELVPVPGVPALGTGSVKAFDSAVCSGDGNTIAVAPMARIPRLNASGWNDNFIGLPFDIVLVVGERRMLPTHDISKCLKVLVATMFGQCGWSEVRERLHVWRSADDHVKVRLVVPSAVKMTAQLQRRTAYEIEDLFVVEVMAVPHAREVTFPPQQEIIGLQVDHLVVLPCFRLEVLQSFWLPEAQRGYASGAECMMNAVYE